ncbi:MAG: hypothetical protein KJN85_12325 [Maribacter sp.]|nr:hypothetical protein [Maribacter sp.]
MKYIGNKVTSIRKIILIFTLAFGLISACDNGCNDCIDLTSKSILVVDPSGINLLFGSRAIYIPENVIIRGSDGEPKPLFIDESTGTIQFSLERDIEEYSLILSESNVEILTFELAERKSERCCGTQIFSSKTSLNGKSIENSELITIIK